MTAAAFGFTEDHDLLRTTVRRLLQSKSPMSEIRKLCDQQPGYDMKLHSELAEMGLFGLLIPEQHGGGGLDMLSAAMVLEEMGRHLTPSPLLGCMLAGLAIERCGTGEQHKQLLPGIAAGKTIASLALTEPEASWEPEAVTARAEADGDGFVLSGEKTHVLWGTEAALLVAPFRVDDDRALFAVELPTAGVTVTPEVGIDPTTRAARVVFDGAKVTAAHRLGGDAVAALQGVHTAGFALVAAQLLGCGEAALAMTRDYAVERFQFGRAIGSFQAVKHPIVNVMIALEMARSHVVGAAGALDEDAGDAEIAARMAKAAATDAALFACDRGIQLHGGFGFTWDCDVHFYFKRAMWGAATLGDGRHHRRHLAERLRDQRM